MYIFNKISFTWLSNEKLAKNFCCFNDFFLVCLSFSPEMAYFCKESQKGEESINDPISKGLVSHC